MSAKATLRAVLRAALLAAALLAPRAVLAEAQSELLEGFEGAFKSRVAGANPTVISEGPGVTQGKQAAQLPPTASFSVNLANKSLKKYAWLKIDTMTVQPLDSTVHLTIEGKLFREELTAVIQPGKDTICLPLSAASAQRGGGWEEFDYKLTISNSGDSALIFDNVRLETAALPPKGCTAIDYGLECPWPGFESGFASDLSWGRFDRGVVRAQNFWYPFSMARDAGGILRDDLELSFSLNNAKAGTLWLWVTHYSSVRGQPAEYYVKVQGKTVAGRRLTAKQLLGPEGILEGIDGDWTPQWYDKTYAGRFYDMVQANMPAGKLQVDMKSCQIAAIATAGASDKAAMLAFLDDMKKDLTRFRRQFVIGKRFDTQCALAPGDEETKAGLMAFRVPEDHAFGATWQPAEADRLTISTADPAKAPLAPEGGIHAATYNGGTAIVPLALAVLKKSATLSATIGVLHSADGKPLPAPKLSLDLMFLQRVPRVIDSHVEFQPWLLTRKESSPREKELIHAVLVVSVSPGAAPGVYSGTIRLNTGTAPASVPVEIKVAHCGTETAGRATFGIFGWASPRDLYGPAVGGLKGPELDKIVARIRCTWLAEGFNSLLLPGCDVNSDMKADQTGMVNAIKSLGSTKPLTGRTLFTLEGVAGRGDRGRALTEAVGRTAGLAGQSGISGQMYFMGSAWRIEDFERLMRCIQPMADSKARSAISMTGSVLESLAPDDMKAMAPVGALLLAYPGGKTSEKVDAFKKLGRDKEVYLYPQEADSYTTGFFAWALGANGWFLGGVYMPAGPYHGFDFGGRGLLSPEVDPAQPTLQQQMLPAILARQGQSDFLLAVRAQELVKQGDAAKADVTEVEKMLDLLHQKAIRESYIRFNSRTLASDSIRPAELDALRQGLIAACEKLSDGLGKAK